MGLSGGLDSSYLAYLGAKKWGLRILAVHVDDGFNTETAEHNIRNLANNSGLTLVVKKVATVEYMDIVRAFIRAGLPGLAIPQDNVILKQLYLALNEYRIKYLLSGANFALESILQRSHGNNACDSVHIRHIHSLYGSTPLSELRMVSLYERYFAEKYLHGVAMVRPLDLIDYQRDRAIAELVEESGFSYYGGKHEESILTKFLQTYYLPKKFGFDKRRSHLSSLVISGQMTREQAVRELEKPLFDAREIESDIDVILAKIGMDRLEFEQLMTQEGRQHSDYRTSPLIRLSSIARMFRNAIE